MQHTSDIPTKTECDAGVSGSPLVGFLHRLAREKFSFGRTDCVLVLADWLLACGRNRDPAEEFRGTYDSEQACIRVLEAHGGVLRIVARAAGELCLARVEPAEAEPGAIGVIRYGRKGERPRHYGAILAPSRRWAVKMNDGVAFLSGVRVAAAWRI